MSVGTYVTNTAEMPPSKNRIKYEDMRLAKDKFRLGKVLSDEDLSDLIHVGQHDRMLSEKTPNTVYLLYDEKEIKGREHDRFKVRYLVERELRPKGAILSTVRTITHIPYKDETN